MIDNWNILTIFWYYKHMETERTHEDENTRRIKQALEAIFNSKNNRGVIENLQLYLDDNRGNRTSIFHENIPEADETIAITNQVHAKLENLRELTAENKREYAFLVTGKRFSDDTFIVNDIVSDLDISEEQKDNYYKAYPDYDTRGTTASDYNVVLWYYFNLIKNKINSAEAGDDYEPLLGFGHTHPNLSESHANFSLPDLVGTYDRKSLFEGQFTRNYAVRDLIVCENGDIDFIKLNEADNKFEKITKLLCLEGSEIVGAQAYSFESPSELSKASYIRGSEETDEDELYGDVIREVIDSKKWSF